MKTLQFLLVALFLTACGGSQQADDPTPTDTAVDCASPATQRTLTYCASPEAAALARQNAARRDALAAGEVTREELVPVPAADSPAIGPEDAAVTIVMFTDLQCPFCARAHESLKTIMDSGSGDIRVVFKHAPLPMHEDAIPASLGALAAADQGKFWEFAEIAYGQQERLGEADLADIAKSLELDMEAWMAAYGSAEDKAAVERDMKLAQSLGVTGTPTMFFNGVRVEGAHPTESLQALINQQRGLVRDLAEAGVPQENLYWRLVALQYVEPEPVAEAPEEPQVEIAYVPTDGSPARGAAPEDALVTIVSFSDFECPFCARAEVALNAALETEGEGVRYVFRHFPLPFHENADVAAATSILMHEKGKFWPFHDRLFADQTQFSVEKFAAIAKELGVEFTDLEEQMRQDRIIEKLVSDVEFAQGLGVRGTPTYFVNGVPLVGAQTEQEFAELIRSQRELGRKIQQETGLKGEELYRKLVEINAE